MANQRNGLALDSPNLQGSCWIIRIISTSSLRRHFITIITEWTKTSRDSQRLPRIIPRMLRIFHVGLILSSMSSMEAVLSITTWTISDGKFQYLSSSSSRQTSLQQEATNLNIQVKFRPEPKIVSQHLTRSREEH